MRPDELTAPAQRIEHVGCNDLEDPELILTETPFASVIESDVLVVYQHTRLASRRFFWDGVTRPPVSRVSHRPSQRALTPVVGIVGLLALTLVLAVTVSAVALGYVESLADPAPTVAQTSGEFDHYANGGGRYTGQVIRITHLGGETLSVVDIELVVDASDACGKTGRLVNLPASGDDLRPTQQYVRGDDIFDNAYNAVEGPIGSGDGDSGGKWSAGETAQFRLAVSECRLDSGERITLRVVHTPTDSVVVEQSIRAD